MKKRLLCFIAIIAIVFSSIFCFVPKIKTHAESTVVDFGSFDLMLQYQGLDSTYGYKFRTIADLSGYNVSYYSPSNQEYLYVDSTYSFDVSLVIYSYYIVEVGSISNTIPSYLTINASNFVNYYTYISLFADSVRYTAYTQGVNVSSNSTYNDGYESGYANGYSVGSSQFNSDSYDEGYSYGYNVGAESSQQASYDNGYSIGYSDGISYATTNNLTDSNAFYNMLKRIFMYPIEFFTTGLNVSIFGVNIGGFCLGIFMISLVLVICKSILAIFK